jgi:peptide/nickel transport system substrate-binding protein
LAKAKALVKQLGGLSFTLLSQSLSSTAVVYDEALQSMFVAAGMNVTIKDVPTIAEAVQLFQSGNWQLQPTALGSWDPAAGTGVQFRLLSTGPFSGVKDPQVDNLIVKGQATTDKAARASYYRQLGNLLNQKAYMPFICSPPTWNISTSGVQGPGLTTSLAPFAGGPQILWQDVSMNKA